MAHFFNTLIKAIVAILLVILGIGCIILPWTPEFRARLIHLIVENSLLIFLFGTGFLTIGVIMIAYIILGFNRQYYEIKSQAGLVSVDPEVFQDYLNTYWKQLFPREVIASHISVRNNKVYLSADLPYIPLEQQKETLKRIDNELGIAFSRLLGSRPTCILSISFENAPNTKGND